MRIAYFSPFPPKQTGIALYSEQLVAELRRLMEVRCYDFRNEAAGDTTTHFADFAAGGRLQDLRDCDAVVYHLGNNPHFHLDIFRLLQVFGGIAVLHDVVLYYLIAGLGRPGLLKHLWLCEGRTGADSVEEITRAAIDGDILRYSHPEKHPLTAAIFPYASRIIVHNEPARQKLLALGYSRPVDVVPHLAFSFGNAEPTAAKRERLRRKHSIEDNELVIACFGFIGPTKRMAKVCGALRLLKAELKFRFLIVGEGDDVSSQVSEAGLQDVTTRTGFVKTEEFASYLSLTDILVNLRFPSMGESSGTLTQAMTLGIPAIVTRDAAFADLPNDVVVKIDAGPQEEEDLAEAIRGLRKSSARARLAGAAQRYTQDTLSPSLVARQLQRIIASEVQQRAQESDATGAFADQGKELAARMIEHSLDRILPEHATEALERLAASKTKHS